MASTPTASKPIWVVPVSIESLAQWADDNMISHLGIAFTEVGQDFLKATMPVDHRTRQPLGLLHGGASVVLAETLGSIAGSCCVDLEHFYVVGLEVNANHVRSVQEGTVEGTVRPIHLGSTTQLWDIQICDPQGRLVCISRLTLAVMKRRV